MAKPLLREERGGSSQGVEKELKVTVIAAKDGRKEFMVDS